MHGLSCNLYDRLLADDFWNSAKAKCSPMTPVFRDFQPGLNKQISFFGSHIVSLGLTSSFALFIFVCVVFESDGLFDQK